MQELHCIFFKSLSVEVCGVKSILCKHDTTNVCCAQVTGGKPPQTGQGRDVCLAGSDGSIDRTIALWLGGILARSSYYGQNERELNKSTR